MAPLLEREVLCCKTDKLYLHLCIYSAQTNGEIACSSGQYK